MRRRNGILAGLGVALTASLAAALFPPLREAIGIAWSDRAQLSAQHQLFMRAMRGETAALLNASAEATGFSALERKADWAGVQIAEPGSACEGRGAYLVRGGKVVPLAVTAPHRGADRHTGTLAAQIFLETSAAAAAWNSAPRRPSTECPHAIDLAREERHPFTTFARAFADSYPRGRIVQLHGFERGKRTDGASRSAGLIVSNGTREPNENLLDLADCLSLALDPYPVRVFPIEAAELGALRNAQGTALRKAGFAGFVHLEMSARLRSDLITNQELRGGLVRCLMEGLG